MVPFISAGHYLKDTGAVSGNLKENEKTIEFKNLILPELNKLYGPNGKVVVDNDAETLSQYLGRIKPGTGSVICEFHFDAASPATATGSTAIIGDDADRLDKAFAKELVDTTSNLLSIKNRGVITESQSHRGKLGLMRKVGIVSLLEICFLTNPNDMAAYEKYKYCLAKELAAIIKKYDDIIP